MIAVSCIVLLMLGFALFTAYREVVLYRKALKGEIRFLVSKSRLFRRLGISGLLILESVFLVIGHFALKLTPTQALFFWVPALILILAVIYLAMRDFRETRRDIDKIFLEAARSAIKKAAKEKERMEDRG
jgi:nitrate/nitrite transporter NarK